ncbi:MAG: DNA mismatch repair endonuclease MutL [Armatimonadetes bacterium]|nr:DNA mismatch repair endonuclease MutL [Armatimonadota bacterium]
MIDNQGIANRISLLDEHTANRIAAGEVVERPASVVKELVENSIDAGATQVTVTLEEGGKELIKVVDNGVGMTRDDAVLSLQRHATSKIRDAEDLDHISTLGFRGEALPSIASVSVIELITKHESGDGVRLEVEAGTVTNLESVGAPGGTSLSVRKLFFNTPARLKFLKTAQTEMSHITEIIGWFAMAYPNIHFRLVHGSREILSSPATGQRLNSITQVHGKDVAKQLVPILFETPAMKVDGFVSNPQLTRINRRDQSFFVNGRPIRSKTITHAVDQAYRGLLQPGRYAVAIVFVELVPELVDVNVHPTKTEVKFSSEHEIHSAVHRAVNAALMEGAAAPTITGGIGQGINPRETDGRGFKPPTNTLRPDAPTYRQQELIRPAEMDLKQFQEALARRREEALAEPEAADDPFVWQKGGGVPVEDSPVPEADFEPTRTVALRSVRVIGQARNLYIIAQCDDGVLLIDQHVAHERVLFDRMRKAKEDSPAAIQGLVIPLTLSFSARESTVIARRLEEIRKAGFDLESFGGNTFVMRGSPASIKAGDAEAVLRDMVQELVDLSVAKHLLVRPDQVLITAACKMAVKAGEPLAMEEMEKLIEELLECENPFVCPHGRPIIVSLSNWELDRKFRRA